MKPYYEHSGITIYHGDCREILPTVTADVLCLDPPYGTNEHGGYGRRQLGLETIENDENTEIRDFVLAWWGERQAICFGSPRRPEPPGRWDYRLVWDKRNPGMGAPWRWQHEMIYLRGEWSNPKGIPSVISVSAGNTMRGRWHPHEKPIEVMATVLVGSAGSVIDPCMGSGSSIVTAKKLGRRAIGMDVSERYCEIAAKRLSQEMLDFSGRKTA
jgi:hypothetical protein